MSKFAYSMLKALGSDDLHVNDFLEHCPCFGQYRLNYLYPCLNCKVSAPCEALLQLQRSCGKLKADLEHEGYFVCFSVAQSKDGENHCEVIDEPVEGEMLF